MPLVSAYIRIKSPAAPWSAAENPSHPGSDSEQEPIDAQRFRGVISAAGYIPATRSHKRRHNPFV